VKKTIIIIIVVCVIGLLTYGCGQAAKSTGSDGGSSTSTQKLYIFRSESKVSGNIGGRAGADLLVSNSSHRPSGNYKYHALISVSEFDDIKSMPAKYGFSDTIQIVSAATDNIKIADNWADLLDGNIDNSLSDASVLPAGTSSGQWWSGSNSNGTVTANCSEWSDSNTNGVRGQGELPNTASWIKDASIVGTTEQYVLGIAIPQ
jgi:hypothetical protein